MRCWISWTRPLSGILWSDNKTCFLHQTANTVLYFMQYLSAEVERGNLHGQARALSTLAGIYEETKQITKAQDHYQKVQRSRLHSLCVLNVTRS